MNKKISKFKVVRLALTAVLLLGLAVTFRYFSGGFNDSILGHLWGDEDTKVLGLNTDKRIHIYGKGNSYSQGGLISLSSLDEPMINIDGKNIPNKVSVKVYKAKDDDLLNYLIHDDKNNQKSEAVDTSNLQQILSVEHSISDKRLTLPLDETGIWLVNVTSGNTQRNAFIVRSNFAALAKEGDDELIIWVQDLNTKRSLPEARIRTYDLENEVKMTYESETNNDGIARSSVSAKTDLILVGKGQNKAVIPVNLQYLNSDYRYASFRKKEVDTKYFVFTDRPLYKPGDEVKFKAVLREDDDARYSIPNGRIRVKAYTGWGDNRKIVYKKEFTISGNGTFSGRFRLPDDATTGYYTLEMEKVGAEDRSDRYRWWNSGSRTSFNVEYYQKPEYGIDLSVNDSEVIAGDQIEFTIKGSYFSGQPLANKEVKYAVYSSDFYEYNYYRDFEFLGESSCCYGYRRGKKVDGGRFNLDSEGEAIKSLTAVIPEDRTKSQIYGIEVEFKDATGKPSFERYNVLVRSGEYGIYRETYGHGVKIGEEAKIDLILKLYEGQDTSTSNQKLQTDMKRVWWEKCHASGKKYPTYHRKEEHISKGEVVTNDKGKAVFKYRPEKSGSYKVTFTGRDDRGNAIIKIFHFWVTERNGYYWSGSNQSNVLSVKVGKDKYRPTETAKLYITSEMADSDVLLTLERGRVNRHQVVRLNGNVGTVDLPLVKTDMPNIFAKVSTFADSKLDSSSEQIVVSVEEKRLQVTITPNKNQYGPSSTVELDIKTRDYQGNPVPAEVTVWAVDKAIYELMVNRTGDIFKTFWRERYNQTQTTHSFRGITSYNAAEMGGGGGDEERTLFKDTIYWNPSVKTNASGHAKVTFKTSDDLTTLVIAGVGTTRDTKVGQTTNEIVVTKDVIVRPVLPNILYVGDKIVLSSLVQNFTDNEEEFEVKLDFDSGVVGSPERNIKIKPNSEQLVSWTVYPKSENETAKLTFSASILKDEEGGKLGAYLRWLGAKAFAEQETDKITLANKDKSDTIVKEIPVRKVGFWENYSEVSDDDNPIFDVKLSKFADLDKTTIKLSLASSLVGSLPDSMEYLIDYPYGCIEQTVSRFVPAVIAKENPALFNGVMKDKNMDEILKKGVELIEKHQNSDGSWAWWGGTEKNYFLSAYVVEYLLRAKNIGVAVNNNMIQKAKRFFEQDNIVFEDDFDGDVENRVKAARDIKIIKSYALALLGSEKGKRRLDNLDRDLPADILALAVMTNVKNGHSDLVNSGRERLRAIAIEEGNHIFWRAGDRGRFGSEYSSTGLALRAFLKAGGDKQMATKVVRYFLETKKQRYWGNSFATAQSIQALVNFAKLERDNSSIYSYVVNLDGVKISSGTLGNSNAPDTVKIPTEKINPAGSKIEIVKTGNGNLYSSLLKKEFQVNREAKSLDHGIKVTRTYKNKTRPGYSFRIGDTVDVGLKVAGIKSDESYGVIEDHLPSGMIPINYKFKSEQFGRKNTVSHNYYAANQRFTENGVIIPIRRFWWGETEGLRKYYRYQARVVSEGEFVVPPATASLMYSPEVYGRSDAQKIETLSKTGAMTLEELDKKKKFVKTTDEWTEMLDYAVMFAATAVVILGALGFGIKEILRRVR